MIPELIITAMIKHSQALNPEEACGLIAFDNARPAMCYCLTNVQHSTTAFTIDPSEYFGAMRHAESRGWEIGGVFHSHPGTPAEPSQIDLDLTPDPEWLYVIVSLTGPYPAVRCYRQTPQSATEIAFIIE